MITLVDWVVAAIGAVPHTGEIRDEWNGNMPMGINVSLFPDPKPSNVLFLFSTSRFPASLDSSKLQIKVDKRGERIAGYRKECDAV